MNVRLPTRLGGGLVAAAFLILSPCASAETLGDYASHTSDGRSVTVTTASGQRLRLSAYGDHMLRVRTVRNGENFFADARYEMVVPSHHASMGGALSVANNSNDLTLASGGADGIRVVLQKRPLRIAYYDKASGQLLAREDTARSLAWEGTNNSIVKQTFVPAGADERFIKAGHGPFGRVDRLDRTGQTVSQNYGDVGPGGDQSPGVVPLYFSSRGYAVFFNTGFDTSFNFGNGGTYAFWADEHNSGGVRPQLDYFLIRGPKFSALLDRYTQLTGRPRLPQISIFGLHMSDKGFPTTSNQAWWRDKITAHRKAGFPMDHQVNDNRWRTGGNGNWSDSWFGFDPGRWPDPAGYKTWADANGVTVTLDYNRNNTESMEGWRAGPPPGYSFQTSDLQAAAAAGLNDTNAVPDYTYAGTRAWLWSVFWNKALNPSLNFPGDGLWIDETDELGLLPNTAVASNGWRWSEARNLYHLDLQKGVGQEGWDPNTAGHIGNAKRPFTWSRGATAGQQRFGHHWTGDIYSSYDEMKSQIRGMLATGLGGFPFANIDGGGFRGGPGNGMINDAFYANWPAAWSALSPIWRPHSGESTASKGLAASRWPLDRSAEVQSQFRKYSLLRYTLMPYIYTLARESYATGMPMARAMVIDYQDRPAAYSHDLQYMWGPSILVAPVTTDGGGTQNIWLPAGETWYNYWADTPRPGTDASDTAYVTRAGEIPMFVKAGAILPRYAYAQSTAFINKRQLEMDVYAGKDGSFTLIEDDGVTENFRVSNASAQTRLAYTDSARRVVIDQPVGTYTGAPSARRYVVRLHGLTSPVGMRVNGGGTLPAFSSEAAALINGAGSAWDAGKRVLSVVTPLTNVVVSGGTAVIVEPSGAAFPAVAGGTVLQAEDALTSGTSFSTVHHDYSGTGFVDFDAASNSGAYVEWTLNVASAGNRTLSFRYANGGGGNRPLAISVNGATVNGGLAFAPTGGWANWGSTGLTVNLPAGTVRIRATTTGSNGANLDSLIVQ